jgi:threonyl-tRNA synthetase
MELSSSPEKFIGTESDWQEATSALEESLKERGLSYEINPQEGAFYGPKIDIKIKDALKRKWQCATIQCDFALPARFNLKFIDSQGAGKQPIMLHRVILGSLERFIGVLIEHYAGSLPLWLSPVQVTIIPINPAPMRGGGIKSPLQDWAAKIEISLREQLIRAEFDNRNLTLEKRIRDAEIRKTPYLLIVGEREVKSQNVSVRKRALGDIGTMSLEEFVKQIREQIDSKK